MHGSRTITWLAAASVFAYAGVLGLGPIRTNDTWLHLTTGRLILQERAVPSADRYSFTATGNRYVAHEWLAAAVYALGERLGGAAGAIALGQFLPALALLAALRAALAAAGAGPALALPLSVLALTAASSRIVARPELFALVFVLIELWLLFRHRRLRREGRADRALVWLVPLSALWANVHASFPIGFLLVLLFAGADAADGWLGRRDARAARLRALAVAVGLLVAAGLATLEPAAFARPAALALALLALLVGLDGVQPLFADPPAPASGETLRLLAVAGAMALAVAANPRGIELYAFPFEFTVGVNAVTTRIAEWKPLLGAPHLRGSLAFSAFLAYLALACGGLALAARRRRLGRLELGLVVALLLVAFRHSRWIALVALGSAPALGATLAAARGAPATGSRSAALALAAPGVAAALAAVAFAARARPDATLRLALVAAGLCGALALIVAARPRRAGGWSVPVTGLAALGLAGLAAGPGLSQRPGMPLAPNRSFVAGPLDHPSAEARGPVDFLAERAIPGRLFTEYDWAGYAIHELWPSVSVFLDSRSEVYGFAILDEHRAMRRHPDAAERGLEAHGVDLVLVRYASWPFEERARRNAGILDVVEADPRWALLYADDFSVLYARRDPARPLPAPLEFLRPRRLSPRQLARANPALAADLKRALERAPGSSFFRFALASQLRAGGRDAEALELLERAYRANPRHPAAPALAGEMAAEAGDTDAARRWYERALAGVQGWPDARDRLAELR